jgi:meso-butanediol dehydrogenase / (S,S)-butanediol dehydrogenase / diacetyl reductase
MGTKALSYHFTDSAVLITGGGTGIGLATARAFTAAGASVLISGRRQDVLDEAVASLPEGRAFAVRTDMSDPQQVGDLVDTAVAQLGRLDVVVSNAAGYAMGQIDEMPDDQWAALRATNIDGFFYLAKHALPALSRTNGAFVAISSISGLRGDWGQSAYNATKGAVSNFVRALALDWGERGVRVNAVAPGLTATAPTAVLTEDPGLNALFSARTALGRLGVPDDIAPAVLFLASDAAAYITGQIIAVDGGTTASSGGAHLTVDAASS